MHEIVLNLHMHTRYSDGAGNHRDLARAALRANLDAIIITDHNVLVEGLEGYYREKNRRVLMLVGEEIHDQDREPQKNHLLVLGAIRELANLADDPQKLIDQVQQAGGLSFLAHPFETDAPLFHETAITWEDWSVRNFTGIELWNGLSELKNVIPTRLHAAFHAFFPQFIARGPEAAMLDKWDELLNEGRRVVSIGGSDAHELQKQMGPIKRTIFPYEFHFRTINTHVFLPQPLTGEVKTDRRLVYDALAAGNCFVGYDLPASTRGFRFTAQGRDRNVIMGGELRAEGGVTLQAVLPRAAELRLIKDGAVLKSWKSQQALTHITTAPGIYRIEAYRSYLGARRGWIFSNPIYLV
jgi:hypothetical protein